MKNMHFSNSILRYAVLLICFLPMALYAHGAQGKRIILKGQSITMQQAIQLIEENTHSSPIPALSPMTRKRTTIAKETLMKF